MKVIGGKPFYGEAIGILMFDNKRYPIMPGGVGNALHFIDNDQANARVAKRKSLAGDGHFGPY